MEKETLPRWGLAPVDFIETDSETIKAEIITGYEDVAKRSLAISDPIRLFLLSIADEIIRLRVAFNEAAKQNLLSYAVGSNLDAIGDNMNVSRLAASKAVTTLQFNLSQSLNDVYIIPAGFEVTNGIITFATSEELVIPAGELTGEVLAYCTTAGASGNGYLPGQITTIVAPLPFLDKVQNITETTGGADAEVDSEYASRVRIAPNSYSVAGPVKSYEYYTFSVSSAIIDAKVVSPNPGEVKIYPLLENGELPSDDIIESITNYLSGDDIRPLTDYVEVLKPTAVEYSINVDYWISKEDTKQVADIQAGVQKAVEEYRLWQQTKIGRDITPDQLISNVKNAGAARVDFSTLSPSTFTELADNEVAQCTGVVITFKGYKEE